MCVSECVCVYVSVYECHGYTIRGHSLHKECVYGAALGCPPQVNFISSYSDKVGVFCCCCCCCWLCVCVCVCIGLAVGCISVIVISIRIPSLFTCRFRSAQITRHFIVCFRDITKHSREGRAVSRSSIHHRRQQAQRERERGRARDTKDTEQIREREKQLSSTSSWLASKTNAEREQEKDRDS